MKAPAASSAAPGSGAAAIDFRGTSLAQVVAFYGKLCGQPARLGPSTPQPLLFLQSAGILSPEARRQGMELLLGVNGLAVVPDDTGSGLKIVPMALAEKCGFSENLSGMSTALICAPTEVSME